MATCSFPLCQRHAEKNGYCIGHRIYAADQAGGKSKADNGHGEKKNLASGSRGGQKSSPAGKDNIKKS